MTETLTTAARHALAGGALALLLAALALAALAAYGALRASRR